MTLLPPNATALERALDETAAARLDGVPVPLRELWDPATCPANLLPWLAWGVSVDFWDTDWSEEQKRAAIAGSIDAHRRKGTRASLREVLDRFDPLIGLVEWFEDRDTLDPHTFRLELPLMTESDVEYDNALVMALLRDIAAVKPLRAHMLAVHHMVAQIHAGLLSGSMVSGVARVDDHADLSVPLDPFWDGLLQTEEGEPIVREEDGAWLEHT